MSSMEKIMNGGKALSKEDEDDFSKFMEKVNDLESIVKNFKSDDPDKQNKAMERADKLLEKEDKITSDRTIINKNAFKEPVTTPTHAPNKETMDQEAFLKVLEADANQRAAARKKRHYQANLVKDEANAAFTEGKYDEAILLYTEATKIANDLIALYTNRAMAYMKLEQFEKCIADCDFAFRIDEKCLKAFVRKGKALQAMKKYGEALKVFNEILTVHPEKEKLVNGYIESVNEQVRIENLEKMAKTSLESHAPEAEGISKLIERISTREDPIHEPVHVRMLYYAGGMRLLYSQLNTEKSQTLFRTEGGFDILNKKSYLCECFFKKESLCKEEGEFASSLLILLRHACNNCIENVSTFLEDDCLVKIMMVLFESNYSDVIKDDIELMKSFTKDDRILTTVVRKINAIQFSRSLLNDRIHQFHLMDNAIDCLTLYATNAKFQMEVVPNFTEVFVSDCKQYLFKIHNSPRKIIPKYVQLLQKFSMNKQLCSLMCEDVELWDSCVHCLNHATFVMEPGHYRHDLLIATISLASSLMSIKSATSISMAPKVTNVVLPLIKQKEDEVLVQKYLACLSKCLERSKESVKSFHSTGGLVFVKKLYKMIRDNDVTVRTHSLKILCICGQADTTLLKNIPKIDKSFDTIHWLLKLGNDDVNRLNQGHAALLLGALSQLQGGTDPLVGNMSRASELIQNMLVLCRDSPLKTTRYNCVIALGKLAQADSRLLDELRRFDGINILARNKPPESYM